MYAFLPTFRYFINLCVPTNVLSIDIEIHLCSFVLAI